MCGVGMRLRELAAAVAPPWGSRGDGLACVMWAVAMLRKQG